MANLQRTEQTVTDQALIERVRIVNIVLVATVVLLLLGAAVVAASEYFAPKGQLWQVGLLTLIMVICLGLRQINSPVRVRSVSIIFLLLLLAMYFLLLHVAGGYASTSAASMLFFPILLVIVLDRQTYVWMSVLLVLAYIALAAAETFVPIVALQPPSARDLSNAVFNLTLVIASISLLNWIISRLNSARAATAQQVDKLGLLNQQLLGQQELQRQTASDVHIAARRIGEATNVQATAAQEQAATMAQVSTSAEQLDMEAQLIAGSARQVSELANQASNEVNISKQLITSVEGAVQLVHSDVALAVERTAQLSEHVREIGTILRLLESITKETHILSLNAAIEAAAAEDTNVGRRFTVVAQEVGGLAARAERATSQVRTIIAQVEQAANLTAAATTESLAETERSVKLLQQATMTAQKLSAMAADVNIWADSIVQSTEQQRSSSDQVAAALRQISSLAQQNANSEQQLQAVADQLSTLVARLQQSSPAYIEDKDNDASRPSLPAADINPRPPKSQLKPQTSNLST